MAAIISNTAPISIFKNRKGSFVPLPLNDVNPIDSLRLHRVSPVNRDSLSGELLGGSFGYLDRTMNARTYLTGEDMAEGTGELADCQPLAIVQENTKLPSIEPYIGTGLYSYGNKDYYFYGDLTVVQKAYSNSVILSDICDTSVPIQVAIWTRGSKHDPVAHITAEPVQAFTEELDTVGRQVGVNSTILAEYTHDLTTNTLDFNRELRELRTVVDPDLATTREILFYGDHLGFGRGTNCQGYYTKFFPVDEVADHRVYTLSAIADDRIGLQEWTIVGDFSGSGPSDYHCLFDTDLGIVKFGGVRGGTARLSGDLEIADVVVNVLDTSELAYCGRIKLQDGATVETIEYTGKTDTQLLGLTRSAPLAWPSGSLMTTPATGAIPAGNVWILVLYEAIPRIEYAIQQERSEDAMSTSRPPGKLTPYRFKSNESLLCIDRACQKISNITLTPIEIGRLRTTTGTFVWGPVYSGETVVLIMGIVLDESNVPIPGVEVTVSVEGPGSIDYSNSVTVITDSSGRFWVHYIPDSATLMTPYVARSVNVTYSAGDTLIDFASPGIGNLTATDLALNHVYAILKDDPTQGTVGRHYVIPVADYIGDPQIGTYIGSSLATYLPSPFTPIAEDGFLLLDSGLEYPSAYEGGQITIGYSLVPFGPIVGYLTRTISYIRSMPEIWGTTYQDARILNSSYLVATRTKLLVNPNCIQEVWLMTATDVAWDAATLNGRKAVLRTLASHTPAGSIMPSYTPWEPGDEPDDAHIPPGTFEHPSSDEITTVFKPVTPVSFEGGRVFKFSGLLPMPSPSDRSNMLGGYAMFGSVTANVVARARDPECYNNFLIGASASFYNTLSPRDSGTLATIVGHIPYGFRLLSSTFDGASTLDTATYLTLNDANRLSSTLTGAPSYHLPMVSLVDTGVVVYNSDEIYDNKPASLGFEIDITA